MDAINLMMEEHKYILRGLKVFRRMSVEILNGKDVDFDGFDKMINFVRNYADKHHHNKEEIVLFKKIEEELGKEEAKGPLSGMYIEHTMGRLYIKTLEEAILRVKNGDNDSKVDIIANSVCYADLLSSHIEKEDKVFYTFARRALSDGAIKELNESCEIIEKAAGDLNLQEKYINELEEMERKLGI